MRLSNLEVIFKIQVEVVLLFEFGDHLVMLFLLLCHQPFVVSLERSEIFLLLLRNGEHFFTFIVGVFVLHLLVNVVDLPLEDNLLGPGHHHFG